MHYILNNIHTFVVCLVVLWLYCVFGNSYVLCIDCRQVSFTDSQITMNNMDKIGTKTANHTKIEFQA